MTKRYEELLADMTGIVAKIYEKGYDKGYEQGKFDQRLETSFEDVKRVVNEDTAQNFELSTEVGDRLVKLSQERRDEIIERAKKDVEELTGESGVFRATLGGYKNQAAQARFVINKKKRTAVALINGYHSKYVYERGIAKAHPNDCFNVHIGKAIALRRALGLEVPDEYFNAPQPTEVRVGDVVRMKYYNPVGDRPDSYYVKIINSFDGDKIWYEGGGFDFRKNVDKDAKIIDDSREEEREEVSE